ncbi:hypothetical protein B0O99DRAFT_737601 [Bisporella sp. PMI_857]|nr:hypothetical protein B0O99DRAFT_737601 [Bisporella sp. PMI_857]
MSNLIILSVNGRHGVNSATADDQPSQAPRTILTSLDGADGKNATNPTRGQPAGFLAVELLESQTTPERVIIGTKGQSPENSIPSVTHVPSQGNVILQAIGGDGEPGRRGEDGQSGRDGAAGMDATENLEAGDGGNGGSGGRGGRGTHGADGGPGGTIEIHVEEDKTHLLMAVNWQVNGGKGGAPGQHGRGGAGGIGGIGGQGYSWDEQTGYRYRCTSNCMGRDTASYPQTNAIARRDPRRDFLNGMTTNLTSGSGIQGTLARIMASHAATTRDTTGRCTCTGGTGHCLGCESVAVYQKRNRVRGSNGANGLTGETYVTPLLPGTDGPPGRGTIVVISKNGEQKFYETRYQLELVGFDLEDENDDGVFEPGEHLFVRRIRVHNSGDMPSPSRQTRLEIVTSPPHQLIPVRNNEGYTLIPPIPPKQSVTLRGSIKALIPEPVGQQLASSSDKREITVSLVATMPGVNRRLENFDMAKVVQVGYPLELESFDFLKTVGQGSQNKMTLGIHNRGRKTFGGGQISPRYAEVRLSIPTSAGALLSSKTWNHEIIRHVGQIQAGETIRITVLSKILLTARDHSEAQIQVTFSISKPGAVTSGDIRPSDRLRVTQKINLDLQISASYRFEENASVLVVTNSNTKEYQFEALRQLIQSELGLRVAVWNIALYGGLERLRDPSGNGNSETTCVLNDFRGKTIVFLGNDFEFNGNHRKSLLDLCHSQDLSYECFAGTSFLFMGSSNKPNCVQWLKDAVFPISHSLKNLADLSTTSSTFMGIKDLVISVCQQKQDGSPEMQAYRIESNPKWYHGKSIRLQTRMIRNQLKASLPQERFLVCPVGQGAEPGYIAVWHGLPRNASFLATEVRNTDGRDWRHAGLHDFDSFNIICSLPFTVRLDLLCFPEFKTNPNHPGEKEENDKHSSDASTAISDNILDAVQFSLEEDIVQEIRGFLTGGPLINNINLSSTKPYNVFEMNFPRTSRLLRQVAIDTEDLPERLINLIRYAISSTLPQSKRQAARSIIMPIGQRRSHLRKYLTKHFSLALQSRNYNEAELKRFFDSVKSLHNATWNMEEVICDRNAKFTKCSTHVYRLGRKMTHMIVSGTEKCTADEWDRRFKASQKRKGMIEHDLKLSVKKRAEMSTLRL